MEQVVFKPHNLPEQLRILAYAIPIQKPASIFDLFTQAYKDDTLPNKVLKVISWGDSLNEITVAECTKQEGQVWYQGKRYVPKADQLHLR
jgi:hypothetical protein